MADRRVRAEVTLSVVAKVKDKIDLGDFFSKKTEWLAEPTDASGCVAAIHYKGFKEIKRSSETVPE